MIPLIDSTGAIGITHKNFGEVARDASRGYLDKIFVDMMWYKAFSLLIMLEMGYHVLFQDLDIVWLRDPFPYIHESLSATANDGTPLEYISLMSDDGQRSLRYSPYFANSGFYYMVSNPSNINFAYNIMLAYDQLVATGSHQNIFTMMLMENLDLVGSHRKLLDMTEFPSGAKYHHDKKFMADLLDGKRHPYMFHMCWTSNKKQKLEYFGKSKMWYLDSNVCFEKNLAVKGGKLYKKFNELPIDSRGKYLLSSCCSRNSSLL
jgi:hypothetical protein